MSLVTKIFMILTFFGVVVGAIALLPDYPLPENIATAFQFVVDGAFWANAYLPIDTAIQIFGYFLIIELVFWIIRNVRRIVTLAAWLFS